MNIAIITRSSLVSMKDGRTMSGTEAGKKNMAFEDLEKRDRMGNMRCGGVRGGWLGGCFKAEELLAG